MNDSCTFQTVLLILRSTHLKEDATHLSRAAGFDWMLLLAVPSAQQRDLIVSFCFETETAIVFLITIPFYSE